MFVYLLLCLFCVCVYVVIVVRLTRLTTFAMPNFEYYMIEQVGKKKEQKENEKRRNIPQWGWAPNRKP